MSQKRSSSLSTCPECSGLGIVANYGVFGEDFYGDKECRYCKGCGKVEVSEKKKTRSN